MNKPLFPYKVDYSWVKTGSKDYSQTFDLTTPDGVRKYYDTVVGKELVLLREFLKDNTFIAYLLAPKNAGKGTYSKGLAEALGGDYFMHVSVGDVVRAAELDYVAKKEQSEVYQYAKKNYRGYIHLDEAFEALTNRSTVTLVPTEFILTLVKQVIDKSPKKTIFVDGFPRNLDQVSYSLYFRELINYREDPDVFVFINAPFTVLDERVKTRRICPECKTPRNLILHPTKDVRYDDQTKEFYLMCDNPACKPQRMVAKEGDEKGLEPIKERILTDIELMSRARNLYGVPKIEIYNTLETDKAFEYITEAELTKSYEYSLGADGKVVITPKIYELEEDGVKYYNLLPQAPVVQLIKQLVKVFQLEEV